LCSSVWNLRQKTLFFFFFQGVSRGKTAAVNALPAQSCTGLPTFRSKMGPTGAASSWRCRTPEDHRLYLSFPRSKCSPQHFVLKDETTLLCSILSKTKEFFIATTTAPSIPCSHWFKTLKTEQIQQTQVLAADNETRRHEDAVTNKHSIAFKQQNWDFLAFDTILLCWQLLLFRDNKVIILVVHYSGLYKRNRLLKKLP
jgi:hypothetical protein